MLSTTLNSEITAQARASLKGDWRLVVLTTATFIVISVSLEFIPIIGPFTSLFIAGAFTLSFATLYLNVSREKEALFLHLFSGFSDYARAFFAYLLISIFILLWSLLLIIPGIIAAFSYMLTFYILSDDASLTTMQAIKKSKQMMQGNKWKAFCLSLRFLGWMLLSILTLGVGLLWLLPYIGVSYAKFYEDIKNSEFEQGVKRIPSTSRDKNTEVILNKIRAKNLALKVQQ